MIELHRLTVTYCLTEDRLRLSGEGTAGDTLVLWLTQRLLNRLIPELAQWLEKHEARRIGRALQTMPRGEALLSFSQQQAVQSLPPHSPVEIRPHSGEWRVNRVNLRCSDSRIEFAFHDEAAPRARITFAPTQLQQWLGLVHRAYSSADWPLAVWPDWMSEPAPKPQVMPGAVVLH